MPLPPIARLLAPSLILAGAIVANTGCDASSAPSGSQPPYIPPAQELNPGDDTPQRGIPVSNDQLEANLEAHEREIASLLTRVPVGETVALKNIDMPDGTYVGWTGTLEACIDEATLYDSIDAALASHDLGTVLYYNSPESYGSDALFLVIRLTVHNVDAVPGFSSGMPQETFESGDFYPSYRASRALDDSWMYYMGASLASFDGASEGVSVHSFDSNNFALEPGETRTLTMGFWLPGPSSENGSDLDLSSIVIRPSLSADNPGPVIFELGLVKPEP